MNLLITGAGGFIGRNLLLRAGWANRVLALDRAGDLEDFVRAQGLSNVTAATVDFRDLSALEALAQREGEHWDGVIYLAGNGDPAYSVLHPESDLADTVLGLVNFCRTFQAEKLIYFSSGAVYDGLSGPVSPQSRLDPRLPYAIGKAASEQYLKFFRQHGRLGGYLILRFFGAYGPYEPLRKIYTRLVNAFALERRADFLIRGDGKNLIDAMYVEDTVAGVWTMLKSTVGDRTVDFCSGQPLTIEELVREAARTFGIEPEIRKEGTVPEYIEFRPSAEEMERLFGFAPRIPLSEGLGQLARHLETTARIPRSGEGTNGREN